MKKLAILLAIFGLCVVFTSCNPFISKELRRKNKCNRKLERVIKKCPELLNVDTLIVNFDTTVITNEVRIDTLVQINFDTLLIREDKFHVKIVRINDTLRISGGCDSDTIFINKFIKVPYNVVKPVQLTLFEQILNILSRFWWWLIILFILYVAYRKLIK